MRYIRDIDLDELPLTLVVDMSLIGENVEYFRYFGNAIREEIVSRLLSMRGGFEKLANTIEVVPRNNGVTISMEEHAKYLEEGTKGRYMVKHIGKTIPMKTDNGVVFRKVTAGSIAKGNWYNPGMVGHHFVEDAINTVTEGFMGMVGWNL